MIRTQALGGVRTRVAAIQVIGGEIQLATRTRDGVVDTLWSRPGLTLSGLVVDSARNAPIANARVDLVGTSLSAVSDTRGRFAISNVLPGTYSVETVTPDLERIGAANESTIDFADTAATYQIRVPTALQLATSLCGRALSASEAAIVGHVRVRDDTLAVGNADVVAAWVVDSLRDDQGVIAQRTLKRLATKSAANGAYRLCGIPGTASIAISAVTSTAGSGSQLLFTGGTIVRADLLVEAGRGQTATFTGRILADSLERPIEGAEIFLPDFMKLARSGTDGAFSIRGIPAGEQHVVVRRVGYGPLDTRIAFTADAVVDRKIFLTRSVVLDSVIVTDRRTDRSLADFEDNRRIGLGRFIDRAELAKQPDAKLSRVVAQLPGLRLAFGTGGRAWITGTRKAPPPCPPGPGGGQCFESSGWYVPDKSETARGMKIACYAQVYIDGVLMNHGKPTPPFEASEVFADQVEALEWYAGPSETPTRYAGLNSDCGVLVVHRRRP